MNVAYLDCFSGISGDMFLGALVDVGVPLAELKQLIGLLHIEGCSLEARREARNGIYGTRILVDIDQSRQRARNFREISELLSQSALPENVKDKSLQVFSSLAAVEAKIHNSSPEAVHFHEVGAVDSIVDIVGSVHGLLSLGIDALYASRLPLGSGFAQTAHGAMPIPVPATIALLKDVPVSQTDIPYEMVTPTGAALVKTFAKTFGPMPPMTVDKMGYGVGSRELPDRPNLLRLLVGKQARKGKSETIVVLETNIDDMSPEWAGYLMECLFAAGALDVSFCPIQMKKNRPGVQVQVIASPDAKERLTGLLFQESGTLGVRFFYTQRQVLEREEVEIESPWGNITVKKIIQADHTPYLVPEYESCRKIARAKGLALREIYSWVMGLNAQKKKSAHPSSPEKQRQQHSAGTPQT
ncbi:MAG: nickel pincer cofactor biosynthesis protein LarC [Deltaproteobacteria bacterium]|nr:nickel pincer cofactor biosynthesis protein LarC [Deltaproteobacteria bacterium]